MIEELSARYISKQTQVMFQTDEKSLERKEEQQDVYINKKNTISMTEVGIQTDDNFQSVINVAENEEIVPSSNNNPETAGDKIGGAWDLTNIVEDVTMTAQANLSNFGFCYDSKTNTYYDSKNNCHYIPELKLYYYHDVKAYYYYNPESQSLCFHSKCKSDVSSEDISSSAVEENDEQEINAKLPPWSSSKDTEEADEKEHEREKLPVPLFTSNITIEAGPKPFEPDPEKHVAPCVRLIALETELDDLSVGTLFIVTCQGGTIGREGNHDVLIPDKNVSKLHANISYEFQKDGKDVYKIVDLGSMNGTYLDGKRLSKSLQKSEPSILTHGSIIKVGSTSLECHIHDGTETCPNCEPSCVIKTRKTEESDNFYPRKSIEEQHRLEVQRLKMKFNLGYQRSEITLPSGYSDRSQKRREEVGSSHCSEKTDSASLDEPMKKQNKGYQMLSRMGWKEGQCLGKMEDQGLVSPIYQEARHKNAGLGSISSPPDNSVSNKKKNSIWHKTRLRFLKLDESPTTKGD